MNPRIMTLVICWLVSATALAAEPAPPASDSKTPPAAKTPQPATPAATPAANDAAKPTDGKEPAAATPAGKPTKDSAGTPQRFIPTEQVRSDFDVSFPVDI